MEKEFSVLNPDEMEYINTKLCVQPVLNIFEKNISDYSM